MAPSPSRLELVLDQAVERLEAIEAGATFTTDAGENVFLGEAPPFGDEDDDPQSAIVVQVEDDVSSESGDAIILTLRLTIKAIRALSGSVELKTAYRDAYRMLSDIKRAFELSGHTMPGLSGYLKRGPSRMVDREVGSRWVGVEIEYRGTVKEHWGQP